MGVVFLLMRNVRPSHVSPTRVLDAAGPPKFPEGHSGCRRPAGPGLRIHDLKGGSGDAQQAATGSVLYIVKPKMAWPPTRWPLTCELFGQVEKLLSFGRRTP